ncbi:hypothetical protein ACJJTC_019697, partial [Scirpophaga incertulas]
RTSEETGVVRIPVPSRADAASHRRACNWYPAKQYHGAPIGTSYDVRAFIAERADEKVSRRNVVRMGIRVLQGPGRPLPPAPPSQSPHHALANPAHLNLLRLKNKAKLETDENCRTKPSEIENLEQAPPRAAVEKPFLLSDG